MKPPQLRMERTHYFLHKIHISDTSLLHALNANPFKAQLEMHRDTVLL
jgi:hypothetical protein